jgi:3-oxoacyl-[acyl-carrier-protein] synthase III
MPGNNLDMYPAITGIGGAFGDIVLSNEDLIAKYSLDSSDEAIRERTGIESRYHASAGVLPSDLGLAASWMALANAGVEVAYIEEIIVASSTPDQLLPSTSSKIHGFLDAPETAGAHDIGAACSGSLYAYETAAAKMMAFGQAATLVVSTEVLSRDINPKDRRTAILFGDGAAAVVLQPTPGAHKPVFAQLTQPDVEAINVGFGIEDLATINPDDERRFISMDGKRVITHAMDMLPRVTMLAATKAGICDDEHGHIDPSQIDLFIPHQANLRMIEPLADFLGIPKDKRVETVSRHGNTSSASIPLALHEAYRDGRLTPDRPNRVLMTAIGAGMVAKAAVLDVYIGGGQTSN